MTHDHATGCDDCENIVWPESIQREPVKRLTIAQRVATILALSALSWALILGGLALALGWI